MEFSFLKFPFIVLEINVITFLYYVNEKSDDIIECLKKIGAVFFKLQWAPDLYMAK